MPEIVYQPDEHRCHNALATLGDLPARTVVECDCGLRYERREDQRDGLYWAPADAGVRHGYTEHGHPCCRAARIGDRTRPPARCGGPALCGKCRAHAVRIHQAERHSGGGSDACLPQCSAFPQCGKPTGASGVVLHCDEHHPSATVRGGQ